MKRILILTVIAVFAYTANSQVLRPFSVRYNNPSIRGNIVYVSNNIVTSTGVSTSENPPGGTSLNNGTAAAYLDVDGSTTFIPFTSTWKYLDNNTRPAGWQTVGYNDAAWLSGTIINPTRDFGYGDNDEDVCIRYGCNGNICFPTNACNKYITTLFRKQFTITGLASYSGFTINLYRDDGVVIYINGIEVARNNMPGGAVTNATLASGAAADDGNTAQVISLPAGNFAEGVNTIAVEVHQNAATSSDITFSLELLGINTNTTFSSSSAELNLPSCSQVLWAGLYWGATQGAGGVDISWINGETSVKLQVPGAGSYQAVNATQTDYHNGTIVPTLSHTGYRCFADITSLINTTNPNGTYRIADVVGPLGISNGSGGWTIVIVFSNPSLPPKNLTVFDGSAIMNGGDPPLHIPVSGFLTPPAGPINCELGAVVFDGDRGSQDEFSFKQDANPLTGLYTSMTPNATSNLNDMWNSTISYKGAVVTSRNPAHLNTLGYDADIIDVPNAGNTVLGNNQTSASIRFSSPSENYFLQVVTTSITVYNPSFSMLKTSLDINGATLQPGDVLLYTINYQNVGSDASTTTRIIDNVPAGTTYKPGSIFINGVPKTDAAGDDEAEYDLVARRLTFRLGTGANASTGGELAAGASGNVQFEVYTPSSCDVLSCSNILQNRARVDYAGKTSLLVLYDSSGYNGGAGCLQPGPSADTITGACLPQGDTSLTNLCPSTQVLLPLSRYGGYNFYTAMPFVPANLYNPATPVTSTRIIFANYDGPGSCVDDTIIIRIYITACPDIDDDDDGLPDYVEINIPAALQDADIDGIPNWNDNNYPGFTDNNSDGFNDNFDPAADSDSDGIPNFIDTDFPGFVDANGDGINDNMDTDLDNIPDNFDLDSDSDGIPDTVESFGVDVNGDGRIDNYTDTDIDGFSQNVDGNNTGVVGSANGLGARDTDSDGIPNYLDLDSDNDGIPDVVEVYGTDVANDGKSDGYSDADLDGYSDNIDSDVGNDTVAENVAIALLRTGTDGNGDGRADSYPYKNIESDSKPNPYDLDSDGDGITDVLEAQFTDGDYDGRVDGAINSRGWNTGIAAMGSLTLPDTDSAERVNPYDIDSDNDGIPDNVEGLSTLGYILPATVDTDADGIDDNYDDFSGFGGDGIHPYDKDGDTIPDYLDPDTDSDGLIDRVEGNDLDFNGLPDDSVTLTGADTDDDGLDDRFDNNNSGAEATSAYMGNGGTTSGDPTPGSITTVQQTAIASGLGCPTERDWRCMWYVLSCDIIHFKAVLQNQKVLLDWKAICRQEVDHFVVERSTDKTTFTEALTIAGRSLINEIEAYSAIDDISNMNAEMIYYRLRTVMRNGTTNWSPVATIRRNNTNLLDIQVAPNPVKGPARLFITAEKTGVAGIRIVDINGKLLYSYKEKIAAGNTSLIINQSANWPAGIYYLHFTMGENSVVQKFTVTR